ncbi:MAG: hypothetical protein ACRDVP_07875 [Acidimicrobiales bacterium]
MSISAGEKREDEGTIDDPRVYLAQVMSEIEAEVQRRRASGELPKKLERELDEMFLAYSPTSGRHGELEDAISLVESSSYVDPVVPVASSRPAGSAFKRALRKGSLWYVSWITSQLNQFAAATSRSLRALEGRLEATEEVLDTQRLEAAPVVEPSWASGPGAWWTESVVGAVGEGQGRVLHAAARDGWLVRRLVEEGADAYGVEPRQALCGGPEYAETEVRCEPLLRHLDSVANGGLRAVVLTGVVDAMTPPERRRLLGRLDAVVREGGQVVLHSISAQGWTTSEAPVEADLASGRPLRARTWAHLLAGLGFEVRVAQDTNGYDYLITASRTGAASSR